MKQYMLTRYYRRRAAAVEQLGGKCVVCGSAEDLQFDHIDPATKTFDLAKALSGWSDARLQPEISKCQLLCKLHHIEKSKIDNGVPHGGGLSGKYIDRQACSCEPCRTKRRAYMKALKASLRS